MAAEWPIGAAAKSAGSTQSAQQAGVAEGNCVSAGFRVRWLAVAYRRKDRP